jgi:hypothetical protein
MTNASATYPITNNGPATYPNFTLLGKINSDDYYHEANLVGTPIYSRGEAAAVVVVVVVVVVASHVLCSLRASLCLCYA